MKKEKENTFQLSIKMKAGISYIKYEIKFYKDRM